jgi:hypothetical protein
MDHEFLQQVSLENRKALYKDYLEVQEEGGLRDPQRQRDGPAVYKGEIAVPSDQVEHFKNHLLSLTAAATDRVLGVGRVAKYLASRAAQGLPATLLYIGEVTDNVIDRIQAHRDGNSGATLFCLCLQVAGEINASTSIEPIWFAAASSTTNDDYAVDIDTVCVNKHMEAMIATLLHTRVQFPPNDGTHIGLNVISCGLPTGDGVDPMRRLYAIADAFESKGVDVFIDDSRLDIATGRFAALISEDLPPSKTMPGVINTVRRAASALRASGGRANYEYEDGSTTKSKKADGGTYLQFVCVRVSSVFCVCVCLCVCVCVCVCVVTLFMSILCVCVCCRGAPRIKSRNRREKLCTYTHPRWLLFSSREKFVDLHANGQHQGRPRCI